MPVTRRTFIKISAGTAAAFIIGLDKCSTNTITVNGHVYDTFGFPVQGALITFVTGYSLKADDGLAIGSTLTGPITTGALGEFQISFSNPNSDVAFRITYQNQVQRITVKQVTGTSIPFYEAEVWSPDSTKWINDLDSQGLLNNVNVYIDPSRTFMWNYMQRAYPALLDALQNNQSHAQDSGNNESPWEGDHVNPDDPSDCIGGDCDDHYDYPQVLDRSRKINPPWGSQRGVIPFVVGEGIVLGTPKIEEEDGDDDWDIICEPQYGYLPNPDNAATYSSSQPGREYGLHCEMCRWFRGKKISNDPLEYGDPLTNISRTNSLRSIMNQRVWMVGSWTVDNGHTDCNELHPVYWIVQFIGGWRRFCAAEIIRIGLTNSGAQSIIADQMGNDPESLLETLGATFQVGLITKNTNDAMQFYIDSVVHLNKFGLNSAFPAAADSPANSINPLDFAREATSISTDQMIANIKSRYLVLFNHLTSLGSGVFIFPYILFIFEGSDMIQQADALGLARPIDLQTNADPFIQVSLGKEALNFFELIVGPAITNLTSAYADLLNKMQASSNISAEQIATYYANTSVRLVSYGMYSEDNPQHSKNFSDHYNWSLPRAKTDTIELINSINVRILDLWHDAFPFARTT